MEQNEKLETTAFVSRPCGTRGRRDHAALPRMTSSRPNKKRAATVYLLARLGVCALLFCGALALKLQGDTDSLAAIGRLAYGEETETDTEERLGRLKFVELPSMIDVFAPSRAAVLPAEAVSCSLEDDGRLLVMGVNAGGSVVSPAAGTVSARGEDEKHGPYVSVMTKDDIEFTLYGVGNITVERGQPVKQGQKLGEAGDSGIAVRVLEAGRPVQPAEVFGLGSAG